MCCKLIISFLFNLEYSGFSDSEMKHDIPWYLIHHLLVKSIFESMNFIFFPFLPCRRLAEYIAYLRVHKLFMVVYGIPGYLCVRKTPAMLRWALMNA